MSESLEYGYGRARWNNSVFGAPRRWMRSKDGVGVDATYHHGSPKQPDFFFSMVWQIDVPKSEKDDNPALAPTVCLKVESPRDDENSFLNDLKRRVINRLLAEDLQSVVIAKGYGWNDGHFQRSDAQMRGHITTTVFRVILADSQIKPTAEKNIQAVHEDLRQSIDSVLQPFTEEFEKAFGETLVQSAAFRV